MYLLTNDKESKLGTTPLPDGVGPRFPRQRPRWSELPRRPDDQVRPHRRQDRAEPRSRPGGDLRAGPAAGLAGRHVDAACMAPTSSGGSSPGVEIDVNSSVAGWNEHTSTPARPQLLAQAYRGGSPPDVRRGHVCSAAAWRRRTTTTRPWSTRPRFPPAKRRICFTRSSSTRATTPSRTMSSWRKRRCSHDAKRFLVCAGGCVSYRIRLGEEYRFVDGAGPAQGAVDHLQFGRPDPGPRDAQGQFQEGGQWPAVQLGQHPDRSHLR